MDAEGFSKKALASGHVGKHGTYRHDNYHILKGRILYLFKEAIEKAKDEERQAMADWTR